MNHTDQIRHFILDRYIVPARSAGLKEVTVRAGDIHKEMGLSSRMPSVCSAIEGIKLCQLASVSITKRRGPPKGANVFVTFDLKKRHASLAEPQPKFRSKPARRAKTLELNPATSLVLISCVKSKLQRTAPAQDLYTSTLFSGMKSFALATGAPWYILSAKYGLVHPKQAIRPYELTLNSFRVAERKAWAKRVLADLLPKIKNCRQIVILAGIPYREFLIRPLEENGLPVTIPMYGLSFGQQLAWLSGHT